MFQSEFDIQQRDGVDVACAVRACDNGIGVCPCEPGFRCLDFGDGLGADFRCARVAGLCGDPIPLLVVDAYLTYAIEGFRCNGIDDTSYCDSRPFEGLRRPPAVQCLRAGQTTNPNDGVCFALCHFPTTGLGQVPFDADCGAGFECNNAAGLSVTVAGDCLTANCPLGTVCSACNGANPGVSEGECPPRRCVAGFDCPTGAVCGFAGTCERGGNEIGKCQMPVLSCDSPVECVNDVDCPDGGFCSGFSCFGARVCANSLLDFGEECDGALGVVCPAAGDVGATCTGACTLDTTLCAPR